MKVKVKCNAVKYYDFEFYNRNSERMFYQCVAPCFEKANENFRRYTEDLQPVIVVSCGTDGKVYRLGK